MFDIPREHWLQRILKLIFMGVVATLAMDLWNLILWVLAGITLDWHLLGRWIGHTAQGDFMLYGVASSSPIKYEVIYGWLGHYITGIMYAFIYLFFMYKILRRQPNLLSACLVSCCFMLMPFCLYQPAVGMGYFASLAPDPTFARMITVSLHLSFGVGLYLGCLVMWHCHRVLPFSNRDK